MRPTNIILISLAAFVLAGIWGCPEVPVGDPCVPETSEEFAENQISVETRSLQCRTRLCLVYYNNRTFCSCRCARPEGSTVGSTCECPEDATCQELITTSQARENIRGSYCVPDEYLEE